MTYREGVLPPRPIYLATTGRVLCLDADTGTERWRHQISNMDGTGIALVHVGDWLFVAGAGAAARLSAVDGRIIWRTEHVSFPAPTAMAVELDVPRGRLVIAGAGVVAALAADNGQIVWMNGLKGLGYNAISMRIPASVGAATTSHRVGERTAVLLDEQDPSR